jgi:2-haloacid dehalogenase
VKTRGDSDGPSSTLHRRSILTLAASATASALGACHGPAQAPPSSVSPGAIRAIAFDALAVFDADSVVARCEGAFPGRGAQLAALWRSRQFDYTWIRAVSRQPYIDFWHITEDALVYAAKAMSLDLSPSTRSQLMNAWLSLKPWPDSLSALQTMKSAGLRLAILSNFTPSMQRECVRGSGLDGVFDHLLSTDAAGAFKPDPRAYQLGVTAMGFRREDIAFAAFGGWDAAGAKCFGFRTFWINRQALPVEELGVEPDTIVSTLAEMAALLRSDGF